MYQLVRVWFNDGTKTTLWVSEDDSIIDAIVAMCDHEGYGLEDVTTYELTELTYQETPCTN